MAKSNNNGGGSSKPGSRGGEAPVTPPSNVTVKHSRQMPAPITNSKGGSGDKKK